MARWEDFYRFASGPGRHGAVSLLDGVRFGISPDVLARRARNHHWGRPHRGVVLLPGSTDTIWRRHAAALLAVGGPDRSRGPVAMARFAAAFANGLLDRPKHLTELIRPHHLRTPELRGVTTFRTRHLDPEDLTTIEGLLCTTPERTVRDLAWTLGTDALRDLALRGAQRGVLDPAALGRHVETLGVGIARRRFERLLVQLGEGIPDSTFEWDVRQGLVERGMVPWPEPFPWRCRDGVLVHLDIAFPWAWLVIECDGKGKYRLGADFTTDRIRWSEINRDWQIVWLDWNRWQRARTAVLDDIAARLAAADRSRAPAAPATAA